MSPVHSAPSIVYWLGENLYLNITNRCSNNCYFCFRKYKTGIGKFNLKLETEPSTADIIERATPMLAKKQWKEIVFCGFGEPLIRLDTVLDATEQLKTKGTIPIRINTNGQAYLIIKDRNVIDELKEAGVDKLSVSLNAHNKETYDSVCKPNFENAYDSVLQFISEANSNINTEITTVTIPEVNISEMETLTKNLQVKLRVRQYEQFFW